MEGQEADEQEQRGRRVIPRIPKSFVWRHFEDCQNGKQVKCKLCAEKGKEALYVIKDFSTTSVRDHLRLLKLLGMESELDAASDDEED